jgi:hypothetical protein
VSNPDPLDPMVDDPQAVLGAEAAMGARVRLRASPATGTRTPQCLDDDTIAALAEGTLDAAARAAVLPHISGCPECRSAVASVALALADPALVREIRVLDGAKRSRFYRIALPAAAAALLLVLVSPGARDESGRPHRSPTITGIPAPRAMSPAGTVAQAQVLEWTAVTDAERYRVTLFDDGGRVLFETQLRDTVVPLPDSIALVPGRSYLWKVEARTGFDRWAESKLVEFSIKGRVTP